MWINWALTCLDATDILSLIACSRKKIYGFKISRWIRTYPGLSLAEVTQEPTLTLPGGIDISRFSKGWRLLLQGGHKSIITDWRRYFAIAWYFHWSNQRLHRLWFLSDLHFGSSATDLAALYTMQQTILKIPNALESSGLGDEIDGRGSTQLMITGMIRSYVRLISLEHGWDRCTMPVDFMCCWWI